MLLTQQLLVVAALCMSTSAYKLHQEGIERNCVDLQCPRSAFESGVHRLNVDDNSLQEDCHSCEECTATGYSVCMVRQHIPRAKRQSNTCSCAHFVPDSCVKKPAHGRPVNGSFVKQNVCYLNSLQTPPMPAAINERYAVIVDVDAFWQEPYWLEFQLSNLKLHYDYKTLAPEHCEGDFRYVEGNAETEIFCHGNINLNMTNDELLTDEPTEANMFEEYDDRPQIEFDREVFHMAERVKFWITVDVTRPRQLQFNSLESPFVDIVTELPSDELDFDIRWDSKGAHPDASDEDEIKPNEQLTPIMNYVPVPVHEGDIDETEKTVSVENVTSHDYSDEHDNTKEEDQNLSAEDEDQEDPEDSTENEEENGIEHDEHDPEDEDVEPATSEEKDEIEEDLPSKEAEIDEKSDVVEVKLDEDDNDVDADADEDDDDEDTAGSAESTTVIPEEKEEETAEADEIKIEEAESDEAIVEEIILSNDGDEDSGNVTTTSTNLFAHYWNSPEKQLARTVFFITIGGTVFIILLALIFRKTNCCRKPEESGNVTTKTSNGYKYHVAKTQDMVGNKERELLNQ